MCSIPIIFHGSFMILHLIPEKSEFVEVAQFEHRNRVYGHGYNCQDFQKKEDTKRLFELPVKLIKLLANLHISVGNNLV